MGIFFKNKLIIISLLIAIILGSFLRLHNIEQNPTGITQDEISIGYNAFTLATQGVDQDGRHFPIVHFRSLADYKLPLQFYVDAAFQKIFGNTVITIRLPSAISGILMILVIFFLASFFFGEKAGVLAALLLAVSPWHAFHSRLGLETNLALLLATLSILFLNKSLVNKKFIYLSGLFFVLSIYTHHIYWVFLPAIFAAFFIINRDFTKKNFKMLTKILLVVLLLISPFFFEKKTDISGRFNQSIFFQKDTNAVKILSTIASQYTNSFSPLYWYSTSGFDNVDVMPDRGIFYFFELPLFALGLIYIIKQKKKYSFLLAWLFLYPLPLVVTANISAARMYQLLPLPQIIEGLALTLIIRKNTLLNIGVFALIGFSVLRFTSDLFFLYPPQFGRYTDYGQRVVLNYYLKHPEKTFYIQNILLHRLYVLYFLNIPESIKKLDPPESSNVYLRYKNVVLVESDYNPPQQKNTIFISKETPIPKDYKKIEDLKFPDQSPLAEVSESK